MFDAEIDAALRNADAEIVCRPASCAFLSDGFVRGWEGRLINIHPSLLPAFKGTRVHERAIECRRKRKKSGATVHFVVPELDAGPVIAQASVPVHPGDTPETLAARVLEVEHKLYPEALRLLAEDKVKLQGRTGWRFSADRLTCRIYAAPHIDKGGNRRARQLIAGWWKGRGGGGGRRVGGAAGVPDTESRAPMSGTEDGSVNRFKPAILADISHSRLASASFCASLVGVAILHS